MSLDSNTMSWSETGASSTVVVTLDDYLYDDDDIEVIVRTVATGAEATLTKTTDYVVASYPGATATVTTVASYSSAYEIHVRRLAPLTQTDDFVTGDSFDEDAVEQALDKRVMDTQVVNDALRRAITIAKTSSLRDLEIADPADNADKVVAVNSGGTGWTYSALTDFVDSQLTDLLSATGFGEIIYPQSLEINNSGLKIIAGSGTPEASVSADVGSIYLRIDGGASTAHYIKETGAAGNTGWVAISTHNHSSASTGGTTVSKTIAQVVYTENSTEAQTAGTALPADDTIPQITEGDELFTATITPTSATNKIFIDILINYGAASTTDPVSVAVFQDTTLNALQAWSLGEIADASDAQVARIGFEMTSGTTSATTFKVRIGGPAGTVISFNRSNSVAAYYGGKMVSWIRITETDA